MSSVLAFIRTPSGAIITTSVMALAALFVNLGLWQLERHAERAVENQVMSARLAADGFQMDELLNAVGSDLSSLEYRRVQVEGVYRPDLEVLVRNMTNLGRAGFHVVTPLEMEGSGTVLVNRGWVPLEMDDPPVPAAPPAGQVRIDGLVRLTQLRPPVGQVEPSGQLEVISRIDIDRLSQQIPGEVAPIWIQADDDGSELPVPVPTPNFTEGGSHLMYAIQWFSFAAIGLVGFWFLVRNKVAGGRKRAGA
jgi:surfeit locus 1 family protein